MNDHSEETWGAKTWRAQLNTEYTNTFTDFSQYVADLPISSK